MATSPRPVLHVGLPRAASTSIQRRIFSQVDERRINKQIPYIGARGWLYAKQIGLSLYADPSGRAARSLADEAVSHLRAEQAGSTRRMLYSHEGLCGRPWDAFRFRDLRFDMLRRAFDDPVVLVVIREPFSWIESIYRFSLEANALSPARFLCWDAAQFENEFRRGRKSALDIGRLSLKAVIEDLFAAFGENNVILLDYRAVVGDLSAFSLAFTNWLGVPPVPEDTDGKIEHRSGGYYRHALYCRPRNYLADRGLYSRKAQRWSDRILERTLRTVSQIATVLPGNDRRLLGDYRHRITEQFAEEYAWLQRHFRRLEDVPLT